MTGQPKDHLAPGGKPRGDGSEDTQAPTEQTAPEGAGTESAIPAEPGGEAGSTDAAARGKATRSPAEVATRPHLEGSEQGPS
jgi:hypothetical protein